MESKPVTAEALLSEIESESLQNLLSSVQAETYPPGCVQIPALDAHFFSSLQHHASPLSSLNRGDVIEIQGAAGTGKTHLVYHLLVTCLMPVWYSGFKLGGWGKAAVVFDTENSFDILRFHQLAVSRVAHLLNTQTSGSGPLKERNLSTTAQSITDQCLQNLHIFAPSSSLQLSTTILHLPAYHSTRMADSEIGLIAIDSLSSFYWVDRYSAEQARTAARCSSRSTLPSVSTKNTLTCVLTALQRIRLSHGPVIVYTNWGLTLVSAPDGNPPQQQGTFYKQHLYPIQSSFAESSKDKTASVSCASTPLLPVTHHITLPFVPILHSSPGMSLGDARQQKEKYQQPMMRKGEIAAVARTIGSMRTSKFTFSLTTGQSAVPVDENLQSNPEFDEMTTGC
ncbi:hypothetical protein NEOLEDRAFT_13594 [Neolentinus lepideus HHB14362 ss-1]|uniref:Uncharacterized protein n=1 Tax=Neolentinus lepideus HHB14362 ss-1 TaxID=1314782 RepID=A0A165W130_9AGAM|nr:hypothetical protein NEOLEDRAFT_13594 [Neolentinus lepideus HHB14362 ss-1]